ncbi:phage major capsid protein [Marinobacter shengliensis]|uniref:phage major capsid protein n=1 Tax=Marinobacter shengliensis TaxID=1389223 RepID=UPI0035BB2644
MADITKQVQEGFDGLKSQVNEKFSSVEDRLFNLEQRGAELPPGFGSTKRKSVVADALRCDQLAALQAGRTKSAVIPLTSSIKALVGDAGSSSDDSYSVLPQRAPEAMYNAPRRRLSLLDVMQSIQVASNSFEFVRLDGFTNAADYQLAEGDAKAEQPMPNQLVSANIATIAALLPTSEQILSDVPMLQQFIQAQLMYGVREKLEREMISGAGGTGQISGLMNEATAFTASSSASGADAIGEAIARLEVTGWNAGLIILHPDDWQVIRSERAATDGQYVAGGWNQPAAPNVWGVPVVTSAGMTEGNALVLDPSQVAMLDRMQARFELGYVNAGFAENVVTARSELRAGVAVFSPTAVLNVAV